MSKEKQYDATLAVLVDGVIDNGFLHPSTGNVQMLDETNQRFAPIGVDMRSVADAIRRGMNPRHNIGVLITEGRLKVALLLDSVGGSAEIFLAQQHICLWRRIKAKGL